MGTRCGDGGITGNPLKRRPGDTKARSSPYEQRSIRCLSRHLGLLVPAGVDRSTPVGGTQHRVPSFIIQLPPTTTTATTTTTCLYYYYHYYFYCYYYYYYDCYYYYYYYYYDCYYYYY